MQIKYTGDPLSDFTLMRFLDRFVFRNPKKDPFKNKPNTLFAKRNTYQAPAGVKRMAPDSREYVDRDESQVDLKIWPSQFEAVSLWPLEVKMMRKLQNWINSFAAMGKRGPISSN